jgi:hypothetical protein
MGSYLTLMGRTCDSQYLGGKQDIDLFAKIPFDPLLHEIWSTLFMLFTVCYYKCTIIRIFLKTSDLFISLSNDMDVAADDYLHWSYIE